VRLFNRLRKRHRPQACHICNGSTTHGVGSHNLVLLHPEPCALLLTRPRLSAGRYQEKGFALRSSRMRTADFCLLGSNWAVCKSNIVGRDVNVVFQDVAPHRSRIFAVRWIMDRSGGFLDGLGRKPNKNEGDVMTVARVASVLDTASMEFASSSACPSSAAFRSACFSGARNRFVIAPATPASALLRDVGGGAPPSSCN